jgi:hypothetical protein
MFALQLGISRRKRGSAASMASGSIGASGCGAMVRACARIMLRSSLKAPIRLS